MAEARVVSVAQQAETAFRSAFKFAAAVVGTEMRVAEKHEVLLGRPAQEFNDFRGIGARRPSQVGYGGIDALPHRAEIFHGSADIGQDLADFILQGLLLFAVADPVDLQMDPRLVVGACTSPGDAALDGAGIVAFDAEHGVHQAVDGQPLVIDDHSSRNRRGMAYRR